jgi:hypothetical protein
MNFDCFICCAKKDEAMLNYCIDSLKNITNFKGAVYVCSNFEVEKKIPDVIYIRDEDIDLQGKKIKALRYGEGWLKQQLFKLLQPFTGDLFLVIDADTVINKPITITYGEFLISVDFEYSVFNNVIKHMGLEPKPGINYIAEIMLFDRKIIQEMIPTLFGSTEGLITFIERETSNYWVFSEFETYGHYFAKHHSDLHSIKKINSVQIEQEAFTLKEIEHILNTNHEADVISCHCRPQGGAPV